jgi:hypothetical protein
VTVDLNGDTRPDLFFADNGYYPDGTQSSLLLSNDDMRYADATANLPQQLAVTSSADAADTRGNGRVNLIIDPGGFNADSLADTVTPVTARALYGIERVTRHPVRRHLN